MSKVTNKIPEILREHMQENDMNQTQLAESLDMSVSAISRILRGERSENVNLRILNNICKAFNLTPNDLLWETGE